jgi:hypothetical protein
MQKIIIFIMNNITTEKLLKKETIIGNLVISVVLII